MPRDIQLRVVELVHRLYGGDLDEEVELAWLKRPGRKECGRRWPLVQKIYNGLTGLELPEVMPPREWRKVDAVLTKPGRPQRVVEIDEKSHFNEHRALTLRAYPRALALGYPKAVWLETSVAKTGKKLAGEGFARACPPLFPEPGGRHLQRAFRDALADIIPLEHGFGPTVRFADFEVAGWIFGPDDEATKKLKPLLRERLS